MKINTKVSYENLGFWMPLQEASIDWIIKSLCRQHKNAIARLEAGEILEIESGEYRMIEEEEGN